ncbi:TrmH family RNA methyltransferase [Streptococcus iniae]|uniref:RNA methyltransferase n=1 Tax=Streptococcus iniae TaxID=1346 RepID=A0A3L8GFW5_STRIN|nr:RNA methyltransferase [Streptococcus iniae]AGM99345.1 SpoU rRNA methylase family protein [Streptococcus iniae SF1]AHY16279.1 23S rRNA methyltransferase [Streptococcus iniae]AHY18142.1 23S rRNA methyltransferase [Streptococcus iniae]AJG26429.1 23S rRNA methyltransferase [Streptococcus iniae]APD32306.1 23S rRNA methyltransferase [Streptococcus iniae]
MIISSKANPLIKSSKKLLVKKNRKTSYLIEGWHLFEEALKSKQRFLNIFVEEEMCSRIPEHLPITCVTFEVLKELTDSPTPQGIIAEIAFPDFGSPCNFPGKYLLLEDVQDPGNLGTLVRTADAAGFDGVILSEKSADLYNPKTIRSMQGSHFHLPVWRTNVYDYCRQMTENGIAVLATTLSEYSIDYQKIEKPDSFVLVMGNEGQGISPEMAELSSQLVHINMPGQAESLNVAVAAGILIFSLI